METTEPRLAAVMERLHAIERQNRRIRMLAVAVFLFTCAVVSCGLLTSSEEAFGDIINTKTITASTIQLSDSLVIVDSSGKPRIVLKSPMPQQPTSSAITMQDGTGRPRCGFVEGAVLVLDENFAASVLIAAGTVGASQNVGSLIGVADLNGVTRAGLLTSGTDAAGFYLYDSDANGRAALETVSSGIARHVLSDRTGAIRFLVGTNATDGAPAMFFLDASGSPTLALPKPGHSEQIAESTSLEAVPFGSRDAAIARVRRAVVAN